MTYGMIHNRLFLMKVSIDSIGTFFYDLFCFDKCSDIYLCKLTMVALFVRPHTNECSGSDLDGDVYFVCWDHELIPPLQFRPMDYTPEPEKVLDRDVTIEVLLNLLVMF